MAVGSEADVAVVAATPASSGAAPTSTVPVADLLASHAGLHVGPVPALAAVASGAPPLLPLLPHAVQGATELLSIVLLAYTGTGMITIMRVFGDDVHDSEQGFRTGRTMSYAWEFITTGLLCSINGICLGH